MNSNISQEKIFVTKSESGVDMEEFKFKFVQLKIKKIQDRRNTKKSMILIQIIDVSHKILYDESKAEKHFLSLINATVSHELRNPLNSLIGQLIQMNCLFGDLEELVLVIG